GARSGALVAHRRLPIVCARTASRSQNARRRRHGEQDHRECERDPRRSRGHQRCHRHARITRGPVVRRRALPNPPAPGRDRCLVQALDMLPNRQLDFVELDFFPGARHELERRRHRHGGGGGDRDGAADGRLARLG
ncbi:MAG: hypothetical protein ACK56I_24175, partial [bacterium]